ncbi:sensor histidine kinase [Bdellovibrio sp. HCB337]|uniref:sensor histidine kinase n=1 Tax=Bdellovibrio sp. HCB337 TaxID=3394358 RepID=UPI0039A66754
MDFETIRSDLNSNRTLAGVFLSKNRDKIKTIWEQKIAERNLKIDGDKLPVIAKALGIFIDELSLMLQQTDSAPEKLTEHAMSKLYGGEKAIVEGYPLSRLLLEFGLVREIIIAELQKGISLAPETHRFIDRTIDVAMSLAATEFEKVQNIRLQETIAKVEASNRDLDEFAMVAAHDLNSPLATVTSLLGLVRESVPGNSPHEVEEYIGYMEQTLTRMRSLVISLLEYARLSKSKTKFQKVLLADVLQAAVQNLTDLVEKNSARIEYGTLPEITGDFNLLSLVFQNLISNSIKYRGASGPEIKISILETNPKAWTVSIKDNGVGFETKDTEEIFKLYKRLENKTDQPGAGIGLATCRRIIELHGGKIWAESQPGKGSTFFFTLPVFQYVG